MTKIELDAFSLGYYLGFFVAVVIITIVLYLKTNREKEISSEEQEDGKL